MYRAPSHMFRGTGISKMRSVKTNRNNTVNVTWKHNNGISSYSNSHLSQYTLNQSCCFVQAVTWLIFHRGEKLKLHHIDKLNGKATSAKEQSSKLIASISAQVWNENKIDRWSHQTCCQWTSCKLYISCISGSWCWLSKDVHLLRVIHCVSKNCTPKAGRHKFCYFPNTKKHPKYTFCREFHSE